MTTARRSSRTSASPPGRDRSRRWSGPPAAARPRSRAWPRASGTPAAAKSPSAAWTSRRSIPEALLSLFSIVFQDVTLFDNTILENIRIGNKDATDEEVLAAARLANVRRVRRKAAGQVEQQHRRKRLRALRRRAAAHLHRPRLSQGRARHPAGRGHRLPGRGERDAHPDRALPPHPGEDRAGHRAPDAHRGRRGQDRGACRTARVAEQGAPEELLARDGLYAHMAALQAESQNWALRK